MKKTRRNQAIRSSLFMVSDSSGFSDVHGIDPPGALGMCLLGELPIFAGVEEPNEGKATRARLYVYSVSNPSVVTRRGGPVGHLQPGRLVVNGPRSRDRFRSKTDQSNSPAMQDSRRPKATKTKISCTDRGWVGKIARPPSSTY